MAETLTAKLLRAHTPGDSQAMDDEVRLRVDQVLLEDYTGTMACLQFEGEDVALRSEFSAHERRVLLAGGLLALSRSNHA
jgi:homoaconitase/3-isopropylmalate dehydratase large subunit